MKLAIPALMAAACLVASSAQAADSKACAYAREALDRTLVAADAVESGTGDVVLNLMPAALAAEGAAGAAQLSGWPATAIDLFAEIADDLRSLAADPAARTAEAAQTLRSKAQSGEAEIGPVCGT